MELSNGSADIKDFRCQPCLLYPANWWTKESYWTGLSLRGRPAISSMRRHSSSVTGITDRREMRTSGKDANVLSALMAARVTNDFNFFTGATSIACSFPVLSAGSGYGGDAAFAIPTTAFTSPVW